MCCEKNLCNIPSLLPCFEYPLGGTLYALVQATNVVDVDLFVEGVFGSSVWTVVVVVVVVVVMVVVGVGVVVVFVAAVGHFVMCVVCVGGVYFVVSCDKPVWWEIA